MKNSTIKNIRSPWNMLLALFFIFLLAACGNNTTDNETDYVNEIEAAENQIDPPPGEGLLLDTEELREEDSLELYERNEAMGSPTDTTYIEPEVIEE